MNVLMEKRRLSDNIVMEFICPSVEEINCEFLSLEDLKKMALPSLFRVTQND